MGSRLSSMLVQEGLLSLETLKATLALQVIKGGELDTILLERGTIAEPLLVALLSRVSGYPPLTPEVIQAVVPEARELIDSQTSERLGICPVSVDAKSVSLLVGATVDQVALEELAFELGRRLSPYAAPEVRLLQARSHVYGVAFPARFQALAARLGDVPVPADLRSEDGITSLPPLTPIIEPRRALAPSSSSGLPDRVPLPAIAGRGGTLDPDNEPSPVRHYPELAAPTPERRELLGPEARPRTEIRAGEIVTSSSLPSRPGTQTSAEMQARGSGVLSGEIVTPSALSRRRKAGTDEPAPVEAGARPADMPPVPPDAGADDLADQETPPSGVIVSPEAMVPSEVIAPEASALEASASAGSPPSSASDPGPSVVPVEPDESTQRTPVVAGPPLLSGAELEPEESTQVTSPGVRAPELMGAAAEAEPEESTQVTSPGGQVLELISEPAGGEPEEAAPAAPLEDGAQADSTLTTDPGARVVRITAELAPEVEDSLASTMPDLAAPPLAEEADTTPAAPGEEAEPAEPAATVEEAPSDSVSDASAPIAPAPAAAPSGKTGTLPGVPGVGSTGTLRGVPSVGAATAPAAPSTEAGAAPVVPVAPAPLVAPAKDEPPAEALSVEEALEAMRRARTRDDILLAMLRGAHKSLEVVQVYVLKGDRLQGHLEISAGGVEQAEIRSRKLLLAEPSIVSRSVKDGALFIGPAPDTDASAMVLISAGILALRGLALVPVMLKGKTICLLAGHNYDQPLSQKLRTLLASLAEGAARGFAELIVQQKQGRGRNVKAAPTEPVPPVPAGPPPSTKETVKVGGALSAGGAPSSEGSAEQLPAGAMRPVDPSSSDPDIATMPGPPPDLDAFLHSVAVAPGGEKKRSVPPSGYPFDSVHPVALEPDLSTEPDGPELHELAAVVASQPPPESSIPALDDLLVRLERGGANAAEAEAQILQLGPSVLGALVAQFPGKLRFDRRAPHAELPPVWECSAVLRALLAFGRAAIPAVATLFHHRDTELRFYATYLMSEMMFPEVVALLATRLQDRDTDVRRLAAHILRRFNDTDQFPAVLADLRADLHHPDPRPRRAAAEALAALGDGQSVPDLANLLADPDSTVVDAASNALVSLTKQDLGVNPKKWLTWWERNQERHRVEWLIEGLVHKSPEIRASAAADLAEITGLTFGYSFDLPPREQEAARRRFLEWWAETGMARFTKR